jgi:nitrate/nitrite transporter NarK
MFLAALAMAVAAFATTPSVFFLCIVLTAIGVYAPMSVWWSYPTAFLSGTAAAGAVGLINSVGNLGGFAGPYLTGWIKQTTGSHSGAIVYLAFSLAMAGLLILTLRKQLPTDPV